MTLHFVIYSNPQALIILYISKILKSITEEAWVKSLEAEIARDRAQLELLKAHRMTYGAMAVKFRECVY